MLVWHPGWVWVSELWELVTISACTTTPTHLPRLERVSITFNNNSLFFVVFKHFNAFERISHLRFVNMRIFSPIRCTYIDTADGYGCECERRPHPNSQSYPSNIYGKIMAARLFFTISCILSSLPVVFLFSIVLVSEDSKKINECID
jgi:hypothetical protein